MKIGRNEVCACGSGKKYKKCCLWADMEKESISGESLPIHKCWISNDPGSKMVVVSRMKPNGNFEMASMLVDEWKMGLKDGFGSYNFTKDKLQDYIERLDFSEVTLEECKIHIKRGILIAKSLDLRLPKEYGEYNKIIGNIDSVEVNGSLYKCYLCGKGDLGEEAISKIKEVTLKDVRNGVCGTPDETMIYFVCDKCKEDGEHDIDIGESESGETEEGDFWAENSFLELMNPQNTKDKMRTFHMKHNEEMDYNCEKCNAKMSAHNKDWHARLCDKCFNKEVFDDEAEI